MSKQLLFIGLILFCMACGVRGRPQPPKAPAEIGRGQPTFSKAIKTIDPNGTTGKDSEASTKKVGTP